MIHLICLVFFLMLLTYFYYQWLLKKLKKGPYIILTLLFYGNKFHGNFYFSFLKVKSIHVYIDKHIHLSSKKS